MDIHRCRFVPYNPQAINALAFSHPPSTEIPGKGVNTLRLAVGRNNGDIEIWNPLRGAWLQESIIRGGKDRTIEGLAWTLDPVEEDAEGRKHPGKLRLFSVGYSNVVTEWDLERGQPARHSSGNFGEIWCLAAQPRWKSTRLDKNGQPMPPAEGEYTGQHLAVGCADGSIVILSTKDGDLQYQRTMRPSTKKARVLSLAFQDRNIVVAGYADSSIRVFDIRNGKLLRTVSLGKGPTKGELLVWSIKSLPNGDIVSGDSAGELRFWDAKNYSLVQRIQGHQADVFDVAVSADGETIVSGGADQRTTVYRLKGGKNDKSRRWAEVAHRRYHTHDVKSLAVYETKDMSIVVSGGLDTRPVVVPLREYGKQHHRKLSSLPQVPQMASSPSSRLLMSWWDREVNFWRVSKRPLIEDEILNGQSHKLVGKVLLQGEENLSSVALSEDSKYLVAATMSQVKMFSVKRRKGDDKHALRVNKLDLPTEVSKHGAKHVVISPNGQWICIVRPDNEIYMARILENPSAKEGVEVSAKLTKLTRVPRTVRVEKYQHGTLGEYSRSIRCVTFSQDSGIVACGDLGGCIDTWVLENIDQSSGKPQKNMVNGTKPSDSSDDESSDEDEDEMPVIDGQRWIQTPSESPIARLPTGILLLSFRPVPSQCLALPNGTTSKSHKTPSIDRLMALTTDHQLVEFDALKGKLSDWSRRNPKAYLPQDFSMVKDRAMGYVWDVNESRERLWLYGPAWMWMFDLSRDFPSSDDSAKATNTGGASKASSNKRKREEEDNRIESNTGAGDAMPLAKSDVGAGKKMRKIIGTQNLKAQIVSLEKDRKRQGLNEDGDEQEYYDRSSAANDEALAKLRREQVQNPQSKEERDEESDEEESKLPNGTAFAVVIHNKSKRSPPAEGDKSVDKAIDSDLEALTESNNQQAPGWWHTYKYRELLGIVPLGHGDGRSSSNLEVAVVERPMWDVELPGRYIRDYE